MKHPVILLLLKSLAASIIASTVDGEEVSVRKDDPKFKAVIELLLPDESDFEIQYRNGKSGGTLGPLEPTTVALGSPGIGELRRVAPKHLRLSILSSEAQFEIRVRTRLYRVSAQTAAGTPPSEKAPDPIRWAEMERPTKHTVSPELSARARAASVRVITPTGTGSGTLVEAPKSAERALRAGETLIATASHVVPSYFADAPLFVDVFDYGSTPPKVERLPARFVCSGTLASFDAAVIAVKLRLGREKVAFPIAKQERWPCFDVEYLQSGFPKGGALLQKTCRLLQAEERATAITSDRGSTQGESGGGLIDPDGVLAAVLSASNGGTETNTFTPGRGLLRPVGDPTPRTGKMVSSVSSAFERASPLQNMLKAAADSEIERGRWVELRLPVSSPDGVSTSAAEGLGELQTALDGAVARLKAARREKVRASFQQALEAYRLALLEE